MIGSGIPISHSSSPRPMCEGLRGFLCVSLETLGIGGCSALAQLDQAMASLSSFPRAGTAKVVPAFKEQVRRGAWQPHWRRRGPWMISPGAFAVPGCGSVCGRACPWPWCRAGAEPSALRARSRVASPVRGHLPRGERVSNCGLPHRPALERLGWREDGCAQIFATLRRCCGEELLRLFGGAG